MVAAVFIPEDGDAGVGLVFSGDRCPVLYEMLLADHVDSDDEAHEEAEEEEKEPYAGLPALLFFFVVNVLTAVKTLPGICGIAAVFHLMSPSVYESAALAGAVLRGTALRPATESVNDTLIVRAHRAFVNFHKDGIHCQAEIDIVHTAEYNVFGGDLYDNGIFPDR